MKMVGEGKMAVCKLRAIFGFLYRLARQAGAAYAALPSFRTCIGLGRGRKSPSKIRVVSTSEVKEFVSAKMENDMVIGEQI